MESRKQPNLIGLWSPIMGSGKTTFANYLVEDHRYKRLSFASTLKDLP
jgi:predicted kinase